jgi:ATP-binding cassette, subfamily B, multidrug efflux pump
MNDLVVAEQVTKRYSAFDAQLTHSALNMKMFVRLLGWLKPYRRMVFVSVIFVLVSAVISVMIPVVMGRVVIDNILVPVEHSQHLADYGMGELVAAVTALTTLPPLLAAVLVYAMLVLSSAVAMYIHRVTLSRSVLQALRDLRIDLFTKLETKPASFYDSVGRVMTRVTNDVANLVDLLTSFGMLAGEFVPFFLALFLMYSINPDLTIVMLLIIPVVAVAVTTYRRVAGETYRHMRNSVSNLNQYMQESLVGMEVAQLSRREDKNATEYGERNKSNRFHEYRAANIEIVYNAFNTNLASIAIAGIVWVGGAGVMAEEITLGSMVLFIQLINMMISPVIAVSGQFNSLFRAMASGERIFQAIDWKESIKEPKEPIPLPAQVRGKLEFRHVNFGYYPDEPVLKDVSFKVRPGEKLAIVGPTGSGKSTLIRMLARFYDFDDNMVFLDGIDVNRVASADLRKRIGIVLQDFHIFSGTVLDNITLNNPDISRQKAIDSARLVNAHRYIEALPDGYDTLLSERGQNLSQGQRQLLAFARVLATDPEILVLDEATANIDTATEFLIQHALHRIMEGRTSLVIAHRLQTIQDCDRILVLHHGVVREYGTHEELMAMHGIYYTLHELQFQDSRVAAELSSSRFDDKILAELGLDNPDVEPNPDLV